MVNGEFGISKDGSHFCDKSPEVIAELAAHPELSLAAAIGNCVMAQDKISHPVVEAAAEPIAVAKDAIIE